MARKLRERPPLRPWLRALLRMPIGLYRAGLGGLLGGRFLLLHHTGRKSGKPRKTVLEVVDYDRDTDTHYVAVGFGPGSDWFKNLLHSPGARIEVGSRKLDVIAHPLSAQEGAELMCRYAREHPKAARALAKFMGYEVDGSQADYAQLPELGLRFVALHAKTTDV